ncbi:YraN family protein [Yoonia sp.]|uniref:YraN family protein n=1 Tax=Yoonia sp. TaxID=2212373 RepID=UPI003919D6D9
MNGLTNYHAGLAAEDIVARDYAARAHQVAARRWRGKSGEIDLIMRDGDTLVFVEVKKSASFAQAAFRLGRRQMDRLCASASEYLAGEPRGQLTDMRFDLALVDGRGAVSVIENAFMEA